jgi:outer membrane protein OmpA-like peptidoglycan-associated protein
VLVPASTPRYLRYSVAQALLDQPASRAAEMEARTFADHPGSAVQARGATSDQQSIAHASLRAASAQLGGGMALSASQRAQHESRLGGALADVRLHTDPSAAALADGVGTNAYTLGRDIYFGSGKYQPGTASGDRLMAHELAHAQQHGAGDRTQLHADLAQSMPSTLGVFGIDMATQVAPARPGLDGHITFDPDPAGPYSADIGLIQTVRIEAGGATSGVGSPLGFAGPAEAERDVLATTGSGGEEAGWHVDTTYADPAKTEGAQVSPSYPESVGFVPGHNEHGFLRSPTDVGQARLFDAPGSPRPQIKFDFETVARGMDNQTFYGGIVWGFEIVGGAVAGSSEYARPILASSPEFELSLQRFRAFFTHEPTIIYFDTNLAVPAAGEDAKLDEAISWLAEFSDAHVEIEGFADERGPVGLNDRLSQGRAESVAQALIARGLDPGRIDSVAGHGETSAFAPGAQAGQLQANRRARIRFVRNASTPPGP